jgi:VanZ family protein
MLVVRGWCEQFDRWQWMYFFLVGYAVVTELIQIVIPGRGASIEDLIADCVGAGFGILSALPSVKRARVKSSAT